MADILVYARKELLEKGFIDKDLLGYGDLHRGFSNKFFFLE